MIAAFSTFLILGTAVIGTAMAHRTMMGKSNCDDTSICAACALTSPLSLPFVGVAAGVGLFCDGIAAARGTEGGARQ